METSERCCPLFNLFNNSQKKFVRTHAAINCGRKFPCGEHGNAIAGDAGRFSARHFHLCWSLPRFGVEPKKKIIEAEDDFFFRWVSESRANAVDAPSNNHRIA